MDIFRSFCVKRRNYIEIKGLRFDKKYVMRKVNFFNMENIYIWQINRDIFKIYLKLF